MCVRVWNYSRVMRPCACESRPRSARHGPIGLDSCQSSVDATFPSSSSSFPPFVFMVRGSLRKEGGIVTFLSLICVVVFGLCPGHYPKTSHFIY